MYEIKALGSANVFSRNKTPSEDSYQKSVPHQSILEEKHSPLTLTTDPMFLRIQTLLLFVSDGRK